MSFTLRLVSYNIPQGITVRRNRLGLSALKEALCRLDPDVVVLQEVAGGSHNPNAKLGPTALAVSLEALADEVWPHFAYARNALFSSHHHGNAVLSRFPIVNWNNEDITVGTLERRGILHAELDLGKQRAHVLGVHLGLSHRERRHQMGLIERYVQARITKNAPLFIAGDFNDWGKRLVEMSAEIGVREAFYCRHARFARTYPSFWPLFTLDRIYFRGATVTDALRGGKSWRTLSDHLPIVAQFELSGA